MWRGSANQIRWAIDIREERTREARVAIAEMDRSDTRVLLLRQGLRAFQGIEWARWWIDNRDSELMSLARKAQEFEEEEKLINAESRNSEATGHGDAGGSRTRERSRYTRD